MTCQDLSVDLGPNIRKKDVPGPKRRKDWGKGRQAEHRREDGWDVYRPLVLFKDRLKISSRSIRIYLPLDPRPLSTTGPTFIDHPTPTWPYTKKINETECTSSLLHVHTGHMHFISLLSVLFTPKLYLILSKRDKQTSQSCSYHLSQHLPFLHFDITTYCIPDFDSCQPGCATFRPFAVPLDSNAFRSGVLESSWQKGKSV